MIGVKCSIERRKTRDRIGQTQAQGEPIRIIKLIGSIMRISRLYLQNAKPGELKLDEERSNYIRNVLRLKKGAMLTVFDGKGYEFQATLSEIQRDSLILSLNQGLERGIESPLKTHLAIGISRGERMDLAIQKAVELGVAEITPLFTERCVVHLDGQRLNQRMNHWQKIIQSACEQCGRNHLPEFHQAIDIHAWIASAQGLKLFLHPHNGKTLKELSAPKEKISLLSGPEGGFSEREREQAIEKGFIPLRLGARILRTETAALAALAAVQTLWGDLA